MKVNDKTFHTLRIMFSYRIQLISCSPRSYVGLGQEEIVLRSGVKTRLGWILKLVIVELCR